MKAYIGNVDWADEGDVFFFSVESEENLKAMKNLIETLVKLDLFFPIEIYWGTNESFDFTSEDLLDFIDSAKDVSEEELAVFKKFRISGLDIYSRMLDKINDLIWDLEDVTQETLDRIKPFYIKLYSQDDWDDIQERFNNLSKMTIKEIVTLKEPAKFSHAIAGVLYYTIETKDKTIMFPIDMNDKDDVGTTTFEAEYKPITLMRYIRKAIEKDTLIIMNK